MKVQRTDFIFGLCAIALAGAYWYVASGIQESMLSDVTGAGGIPRALAWTMGGLGVLLCLRSLSSRSNEVKAALEPAEPAVHETPPATRDTNPHIQALVLLGILVAYVVLAPYLGYIVATSILIGAAAAYGGAAITRNLVLISAAGGIGLWLVFAKMLGIAMQSSVLFENF